jgi:HSP20 family molecular chaperone IbpA
LGDLAQLQDRINRAFSDTYGRGSGPSRHDEGLMTTGTWAPPVDIDQNADQELVLTAELPDMSPDDIEITINNDTLTIRGEKRFSSEVRRSMPPHRAAVRQFQPFVLASLVGRCNEDRRLLRASSGKCSASRL